MFCNKCGKKLEDGSLFCNYCGNKINITEENSNTNATVTDSISAKVSDSITEKLISGREAKKRKDWRAVQRIYQSVLTEIPDQYEALFYDAYAKAMESMTGQDVFKRKAEMEVVHNVLSSLPNYYVPDDSENLNIVSFMLRDMTELICFPFVFTQTKNGFGMVIASNAGETYAIFVETVRLIYSVTNSLYEKKNELALHRCALEFYLGAQSLAWDYNSKVAIANDVTKWIDEEKQNIENIRRGPIEAYWKEHAEERIQLEAEKKSASEEIDKLKEEISSLEESDTCKQLENELKEIDEKLSGTGVTGIFKGIGSSVKEKGVKSILGIKGTVSDKMSEKKELQAKRAEVEKLLDEAKAKLSEVSKPQNDRIASLQQRIDQINEEFDKDR